MMLSVKLGDEIWMETGTTKVSFVLTSEGAIDSLKIDSAGPSARMDRYVLSTIKFSKGKWIPGKINNEKINSIITVFCQLYIQGRETIVPRFFYASSPTMDYGIFYYNLGVKYAQESMYDKAIECFTSTLEFEPKNIDALFNRGIMYHKVKNDSLAWYDWQRAKSLGDSESERFLLKYCPNDSIILDNEIIYTRITDMPVFPNGGEKALLQFLSDNVKKPKEAKSKQIGGTVYASFIVDSLGKIENAKILKGIGYGCDEEVIRVINLMPQWIPGKIDGKPVNVQLNFPLKFR